MAPRTVLFSIYLTRSDGEDGSIRVRSPDKGSLNIVCISLVDVKVRRSEDVFIVIAQYPDVLCLQTMWSIAMLMDLCQVFPS